MCIGTAASRMYPTSQGMDPILCFKLARYAQRRAVCTYVYLGAALLVDEAQAEVQTMARRELLEAWRHGQGRGQQRVERAGGAQAQGQSSLIVPVKALLAMQTEGEGVHHQCTPLHLPHLLVLTLCCGWLGGACKESKGT